MAYHMINNGSNNKPNNNGNNNPNTPNNNGGAANNNGGNNTNNGNSNGNPTITSATNQSLNQPQVPETLIDYAKLAKNKQIHHVQFRDQIIKRLLTTLTTTNHPNALLVGDAGTGKTAIVEDLALRLYEKDPIVTAMLGEDTKIYELPLNNLVAGSSMMGATEAKVKEVLNFISNPQNHAILYLDEIHQLMTNNHLKNVAEMIKPALSRGNFHTIGSTTTQELKFWQQNPAMTRRFSNIIVNELTDDQTIEVLAKSLPILQQNKPRVQMNPKLFTQVVQTGNEYARTLATHRPDSAITILDQALSIARLQSLELKQSAQLKVAPKVTTSTIQKAGKQLLNDDTKQLNQHTIARLKTDLDQNVIGQKKAKQALINAVQSMVLDLVPQTKPHSFLFAGLTGTGKTEVAKQLANALFDSPKRYIYLNMTEFASRGSITSLIGSSRGYIGSDSAQPLPLDPLKSNPMQIVLLDEFEKADIQVRKLFMQALDEGSLKYADGSIVDFSHAIIIATTNAGTQNLDHKTVGFNQDADITSQELNDALKTSFPPELINRFEHVIGFNAITKDQYKQVLVIKYNQLIDKVAKHHPELDLEPQQATTDQNFIQKLADQTYHKMKNARPAGRSVEHFVEKTILAHPGQSSFNFDAVETKTDSSETDQKDNVVTPSNDGHDENTKTKTE